MYTSSTTRNRASVLQRGRKGQARGGRRLIVRSLMILSFLALFLGLTLLHCAAVYDDQAPEKTIPLSPITLHEQTKQQRHAKMSALLATLEDNDPEQGKQNELGNGNRKEKGTAASNQRRLNATTGIHSRRVVSNQTSDTPEIQKRITSNGTEDPNGTLREKNGNPGSRTGSRTGAERNKTQQMNDRNQTRTAGDAKGNVTKGAITSGNGTSPSDRNQTNAFLPVPPKKRERPPKKKARKPTWDDEDEDEDDDDDHKTASKQQPKEEEDEDDAKGNLTRGAITIGNGTSPSERNQTNALVDAKGNLTKGAITGHGTSPSDRNQTNASVETGKRQQDAAPIKLPETPLLDPLGPHFNLSSFRPLNLTCKTKYLGVLLDGGRNYYSIDWIKRMIDMISVLQYNVIHFRLTDDQTFNVHLQSQPDLAYPTQLFGNNKTYTPEELRDLVAYAKTRKIQIIPEINVPGHAGSWAGIPGLIVQCPEFICQKGYGLPLNITHPKLRSILTDVIREVIDIFDTPSFLHLGGDEVEMSKSCFAEVGAKMFNYSTFEYMLKEILHDVGYPEEQVIRWQKTGKSEELNQGELGRAGHITQFWHTHPGETQNTTRPFFGSAGLYLDTNGDQDAWGMFNQVQQLYHLNDGYFPLALIIGTFELDSELWFSRNVIGRLLAVTLGASVVGIQKKDKYERIYGEADEFYRLYGEACRSVGFQDKLCQLEGKPTEKTFEYRRKWQDIYWRGWKANICERLTVEVPFLEFHQPYAGETREAIRTGSDLFWRNFGTSFNQTAKSVLSSHNMSGVPSWGPLAPLRKRLVKRTGVIVDFSLDAEPFERTQKIIRGLFHTLGFNLIQLRMSDDFAFGYRSEAQPGLSYPEFRQPQSHHKISLLRRAIFEYAETFGIEVMPEISISTRAGGWYKAGFNVPCPHLTCENGTGIPQNVNDPNLLPVAYSVVRELLNYSTSEYIHLGADEREESMACFAEAGIVPDFESFERKLSTLLSLEGIPSKRIIRWENQERIIYPGRVGSITHCRSGDCRNNDTEPWFATVNLISGGLWSIYNTTRELALRRPTGIVAEFGSITLKIFEANQVRERLLAFAMGTSDTEGLNRTAFETQFSFMCEAKFGYSGNCNEFDRSDQDIHDDSPIMRLEEHRQRLCRQRTVKGICRVFRTKVPIMDTMTSIEMEELSEIL